MTVQGETQTQAAQAKTSADGVILSDTAASKVKSLLEQEGRDDLRLRIAVQPGGCSGMRYALFFDDRQLDGDVAADLQGVPVRVDKMSAPYLRGTEIDWVDSLQGAGFAINNPNVVAACGCGSSFRVKDDVEGEPAHASGSGCGSGCSH